MTKKKLTVLITNIELSGRSGTEIVTRNLALGLLARGHLPIVYTNTLGPIAEELRRASIPVTTDITQVAEKIDVIHGHHTPVTAIAATNFPEVPAIFLAHDFTSWFDIPPCLPSIRRCIAVDQAVATRLTAEHGLHPERVSVILNAVDMQRFTLGPTLPPRPKRALAFAKNRGHLEPIAEACAARGIALDTAGPMGERILDKPETELPQYDLVFASALTALEAMACGRAVISCDGRGLAGLVTASNYARWRPLNFGARTLLQSVNTSTILREIDKYSPSDSVAVSEMLRQDGDIEAWLDAFERVYYECIEEVSSPATSQESFSTATARHMQLSQPRLDQKWPWMMERQQLLDRIERLNSGLSPVDIGTTYFFTQETADCDFQLVHGFSDIEAWGVWTDGAEACVRIRLPKCDAATLQVIFGISPFVQSSHPHLDVEVMINGTSAAMWSFHFETVTNTERRNMIVPTRQLDASRHAWLTFHIKSPISPMELGASSDSRRMGLGFKSFVVTTVSTNG